ncbi:protein abnormal spindle-like [Teleopsis dalmanni]|uniref:protein abnormal spindle-like n=1 Tax=Teleopsis dalmanni TaxID=139649 RepID=UPI0018CDB847|nr:protein abnormal spindle-like [Teleopsis dalmanni]
MINYEVKVSPCQSQNKKGSVVREPTNVVMALFSAKSIVEFREVPITKTAKRILNIINTGNVDIHVKVTKPIKPQHCISLNWHENVVPAQSEVKMEMVWSPQKEIACTQILQLTDNRNFRKDIMVIMKTRPELQKPRKVIRKSISRPINNETYIVTSPKFVKHPDQMPTVSQQKRRASMGDAIKTKLPKAPQQSSIPKRRTMSFVNKTPTTYKQNNYFQKVSANNSNRTPVNPIPDNKKNKDYINSSSPANGCESFGDNKFTPPSTKINNENLYSTPIRKENNEQIRRQSKRPQRQTFLK